MQYEYPTHLEMKYTDSKSYRKCIRNLFSMSTDKYPQISDDIDDVSRDELEYDEQSANIAMNYVYEKTRENKIFIDLYSLAAARMFSTDLETGLAILLSYDYLELFHYCLVFFFTDYMNFNNTIDCVVELHKRL